MDIISSFILRTSVFVAYSVKLPAPISSSFFLASACFVAASTIISALSLPSSSPLLLAPFIFSSRYPSSSSLDDDDDENFQYFLNPHTVNEIKDRLDEIKEKNRIIRDLNNRLQAEIKKREHHQSEAEAYGSEAKSLREKVSNLLMRLSLAENRAEYYKNMLKERYTERIEEEGYLEEKMRGASKRGELLGKDSADVIVEAAAKQAEAKKKLDEIGAGSFTAVSYTHLRAHET